MTKTALIAVDVQNDFIDGSLGGQSEQAIIMRRSVIAPLVRIAADVDLVIASRDWHPADHVSFSDEPTFTDGSWPAHCVQGTPGAEIAPLIAAVADMIVSKGTDRDREAYSAFAGRDQYGRELLAELAHRGIKKVIVGGIATDYCVRATVLDAIKYGFEVELALDASCGVANDTAARAVIEMEAAGAVVTPYRLRFRYQPSGGGNVQDLHAKRDRLAQDRAAEFEARPLVDRAAERTAQAAAVAESFQGGRDG